MSPAGYPRGGSLSLERPSPVRPNVANLDAVEDEESVEGGSDLSDVEDVFVEDEAELPKTIKFDNRPSEEEVRIHNRTHLPYRSWCPHCVRGKARRHHRRRMKRLRSKVPVISLDYMWMKGRKGDGEEPKGNPILVMHCRDTKLTWSRVVLRKGVDPYSMKVLSDMILFTGLKRVILKSDGESSIKAVKEAVKNSVNFNLGVEVSPV